ncbi:hypothetical protein V9T40_001977 [Parthenolecanium corni]|uniref:Uncharacterized protein n=1 Tax=Parthenolecanium corni TaxID=536013 RepID=A0AAN9THJ9_9HEMI
MKSLTLDSLRRLISRNRKKDKHESSFKRSESFKRISIKKNYLDRGGKGRNATKFAGKKGPVAVASCADGCEAGSSSSEPKKGRCKSPPVEAEAQIIDYGEWIRCIQEEIKVDPQQPQHHSKQPCWSSPQHSLEADGCCYADCSGGSKTGTADRMSSSASSISSPPPLHPRRLAASRKRFPLGSSGASHKESCETLADDGGASSKTDSAISVSLGRIWMDAPLTMTNAPRSLELPKQVSVVELHPSGQRAHHSLESALKERKEEQLPPACSSFFAKNGGPSGGFYRGLSSSKDSGFSFSISIPRLSPVMSPAIHHQEHGGGLFRKKKSKPAAQPPANKAESGAGEGGFGGQRRRTPSSCSDYRRRHHRQHHRGRKELSATSMYQVVVNRPSRSSEALKLDPIIFVPPEKRKSTMKRVYEVQEIRDYCMPCDVQPLDNGAEDSDTLDELYEVISEEQCAIAEHGVQVRKPAAHGRRRLESEGWTSETADSDEEDEAAEQRLLAKCSSPAQHANYSPYLKRRPVVRKKSTHRNVRYVAKPIHRAPSTLKRSRKVVKKNTST